MIITSRSGVNPSSDEQIEAEKRTTKI